MNQAIPYILAFLALLYLALPHVYECYVSYSRPWNTHEEMTNADVASKHEFHSGQPTVWEMFTETEVTTDKELAAILPGETVKPAGSKTILPGVPTPKNDVLAERLNSRPGKTIPGHVMNNMMDNIEMPTLQEGFDSIINTNPIFC